LCIADEGIRTICWLAGEEHDDDHLDDREVDGRLLVGRETVTGSGNDSATMNKRTWLTGLRRQTFSQHGNAIRRLDGWTDVADEL